MQRYVSQMPSLKVYKSTCNSILVPYDNKYIFVCVLIILDYLIKLYAVLILLIILPHYYNIGIEYCCCCICFDFGIFEKLQARKKKVKVGEPISPLQQLVTLYGKVNFHSLF